MNAARPRARRGKRGLLFIFFAFAVVVSSDCNSVFAWVSPPSFSGPSISCLHASKPLSPSNFLRWKPHTDSSSPSSAYWEMETAVVTMVRNSTTADGKTCAQTVELHSQLHLGSSEYFSYYNSPRFNADSVLYELLVDDHLLLQDGDFRRLPPDAQGRSPIGASPSDKATASQYGGWTCQADVINYSQCNWIHADYTRQEFLENLAEKEKESNRPSRDVSEDQPLWRAAQRSFLPEAAVEAGTALLVGPPVLLDGGSTPTRSSRKLFSNLFLAGGGLASLLRAALWMTVPSPEVSVLLLDWSSLFWKGRAAGLSAVSQPVLFLLSQGQLEQVRALLFGQVALVGSTAAVVKGGGQSWSLLVTSRNDRALQVLEQTFRSNSVDNYKVALLYGSSHCPDLQTKLAAAGFVPKSVTWRTAWSVPTVVPDSSAGTVNSLLFLLPLYLVVGGTDYIVYAGSMAEALANSDGTQAVLQAFLYLMRHVLLYVGLSKFVLEWQDPGSVSSLDENE